MSGSLSTNSVNDCRWPDDVASAGDVFFFPAGHTLIYEELSEVLELNPAAALQSLMNHFETKLASGWTGS